MKTLFRIGAGLAFLAGCGGGLSRSIAPTVPALQHRARSNAFAFSQYKGVTVTTNWNTNAISTKVTGTFEPALNAMPEKNTTLTWAFATGSCGSETWEGIPAAALRAANIQSWVSAGKYYIISTGGAGSTFTCPSTSAFLNFVKSYYSANMIGVDFDIENGQSQTTVNDLVQDVKAAQSSYPGLRFSFTVGTLGGNANPSLGYYGILVMNAIKRYGLTNYTIDLMTMDYGSANPGNCVVIDGKCEMGKSAVRAAENLNAQFGAPYSQSEITPMIGGTIRRARRSRFPMSQPCRASCGAMASPACTSGRSKHVQHLWQGGHVGFTNAFIADLGL